MIATSTLSIKDLRRQKKLTQEELAQIAGLSRVALLRIEKGEAVPTDESKFKIASALGVAVEELYSPSSLANRRSYYDVARLLEENKALRAEKEEMARQIATLMNQVSALIAKYSPSYLGHTLTPNLMLIQMMGAQGGTQGRA